MRTKHFPLFGVVLAAIVAVLAIAPGALTGEGGPTAEAVVPEESGAVAVAETALDGEQAGETVANCRYGSVAQSGSTMQSWIDDLGAGWWLDFKPNYSEPADNGAEYAHVVWVQQVKNGRGQYLDDYFVIPSIADNSLGYLLERRPGRMWIIGNEVDRGPNPGGVLAQGDTMPQMYARIYHDVYHYIKKWDPTALVTPSALVEFTPARAQYLDIVYDTYRAKYGHPMPVDFWNMHLYILAEVTPNGSPSLYAGVALGTNPALGIVESGNNPANCALDHVYCRAEHDSMEAFADQVVRMRTWMKNHGYQNYPLIITEYSLLLPYETRPAPEGCWEKDEFGNCFTPERVRDYANATFNYLETTTDPDLGYPYDNHRLVQQWMWYGIYWTGQFQTSNLATSAIHPLDLTLAGQAFSAATRVESPAVNLVATKVNHPLATSGNGTVSALFTVEVRNNGNTRVNEPITITLYKDKALTKVIGTTTISAPNDDFMGMTGCAVRGLQAAIYASWTENMENGIYPFWAKVDSAGSIDESDETDNVTSGTFMIVPARAFIPMVVR